MKEFSKKQLSILKYFEKEYGNIIEVYFIPNSYGTYYLINPINGSQIGRLFLKTDGSTDVSYDDNKNINVIHQLFNLLVILYHHFD